MDTLTFVWIGTAALVMTLACFTRMFAGKGASMEAIGGVMASVLWGVFAIGSFDLEKFHGSSTTEISVESLAVVGVAFAAVMVLYSFQAMRGALREPSDYEEVSY